MNTEQTNGLDFAAVQVLVVEDEPFTRNIVCQLLEKIWVTRISQAEDGADALKQLSTAEPDLVVLDIMMENMNGLQFLKALRTGLAGYRRELPVIVLTGAADEAVMGTALALDCDSFLRKPDGLNVLDERIARVLGSPQEVQPSSVYRAVTVPDVNESTPAPKTPISAPAAESGVLMPIYEVEPGAILDRDLVSPEGHLLLAAGAVVTEAYLHRLSDISEMIDLPELWIRRA